MWTGEVKKKRKKKKNSLATIIEVCVEKKRSNFPIVNREGGSVMLCGCEAARDTGNTAQIDEAEA